MAEDIQQIIKIDTGEAITNLKDYKKHIDDLKGSMLGLEKGSEEYNKVANEVAAQQEKLNEVMVDSKYGVDANTKSYNALAAQMSQLKKEWKNMDMGSEEWKKTAEQINELNDKLKDADAKTGNFQRNVGNYAGGFLDAFSKMSKGAASLNSPLKTAGTAVKAFGNSLKVLAANPIGAIIMVIVVAVKALVEAFKRNEKATLGLQKAMAPLKAIIVGVQKAFDFLATAIGNVLGAIGDFVSGLFGVDSAAAKLNKIAEDELKLSEQTRQHIVENADAEKEAAELRAKSAEKNKYTAKERIEFLRKAGEIEADIAKKEYEDLKLQYEIVKAKNALTESSAEEKLKEAQAYAAMINAETNFLKKKKEINAQITEAQNSLKQEYIATLNAQKSAIDAQLAVVEKGSKEEYELKKKQVNKAYEISVQSAKNSVKNAKALNDQLVALAKKRNKDLEKLELEHTKFVQQQENDRMEIKANNMVKGSTEYYNQIYELRKKEREDIIKNGKLDSETQEQYILRQQKATEALRVATLDYVNSIRNGKLNPYQLIAEEAKKGSIEEAAALEEIARLKLEFLEKDKDYLKTLGITEQEYALMMAEANNNYQKAIDNTLTITNNANQQILDNQARLTEMEFGGNSMEAYDARIAAFQNYYSNLFQLQDESNEEFKARQLAAEDQLNAEIKAKLDQRISNYSSLASGIGDIMGSIADIYEQDIQKRLERGEISEQEAEQEFENAKKLQIAQATIQMLVGITAAVSGLFTTKTGPWDIAIAAVQAAAIAAAGIANIAKIKSTTFGGSSSSAGATANISSAAATPRASDYSPAYTASVTGLNEQTNLNEGLANTLSSSPIKAYVVESEITESQKKAQQRKSEATF